ncbi:uncharacterized protein LOC116004139 [Ipomoea triloba]|uniref:uncharacterized protein LOC116004139 n=1 Tax=Ipomoea triloba TaxID=35885 RepID=UPI00125D115C|nr:uncharacterized protein LOC116004139 [Ipomoea triloba]
MLPFGPPASMALLLETANSVPVAEHSPPSIKVSDRHRFSLQTFSASPSAILPLQALQGRTFSKQLANQRVLFRTQQFVRRTRAETTAHHGMKTFWEFTQIVALRSSNLTMELEKLHPACVCEGILLQL